MSGTFSGSPTAPTIDASGIRAPDFNELVEIWKERFRAIYGADLYLEPDSQDGQLVSILATANHDANSAAIAAYAGFSPATAQGAHLARMVKINGLVKPAASYSTVDLVITGLPNLAISGGIVKDQIFGNRWLLPDFVIGPTGTATVTAIADRQGAVTAGPDTIRDIATPQYGWTGAANPQAAVPGQPVETDVQLRTRQAVSTALPSQTILEGLQGALEGLLGTARVRIYENDSGAADANGLPPHSLAAVVEGGQSVDIARVIADKKSIGARTVGTTLVAIQNAYGKITQIGFYRPTGVRVRASITIKPLFGYSTPFAEEIKAAVAEYINTLPIGEIVEHGAVYLPANLYGQPNAKTYKILPNGIRLARGTGGLVEDDVAIAFNEVATCSAATDVEVILT